jgi:aspartate/methionine/tyrosine aminotransferase
MLPAPFEIERYFARYEFQVRHLLSASDCQTLKMTELLELADEATRRWWDELSLHYTQSQGHPILRAEIARLHQQVSADEVLVAAPEEAIYVAMHTMLSPGDHVIVVSPCYQSLAEVARANGCEVTPWELRRQGDGWALDFDALERALTPRTRLLVINFPHNPTGHLPTLPELERVIGLCRDRNLYLFSDEMYQQLEPTPEVRLPAICDVYERGISLSGLSKSFGLPGLRIGWLVTRERRLLEAWLTLKDYLTICPSAPSEVLAVVALRARESILERNRAIVAENLRVADDFFGRRDWFTWLPPRAGSVAFPEWKGDFPLAELCQRTLDRGLLVVPGRFFGHAGAHFRVGLGRTDFPQALAELSLVVDG